MGLTLGVYLDDRDTIVRVGGEIDVCVADPLQDGLLRIMRAHTTRLLLDLSEVSFMDCAGLQALELTGRRATLRGGSIHLIAVSPAVRRIIDLTGLRDAFPVHDPRQLPMAPPSAWVNRDGGDDTWTSPTGVSAGPGGAGRGLAA